MYIDFLVAHSASVRNRPTHFRSGFPRFLELSGYSLELTLQSLSPVLALYDPFGVDVPLNLDITHSLTNAC